MELNKEDHTLWLLSDLLISKFLFILSTVVGPQKLNVNPPIVFLAVIFRESTDMW